MFSMGPLTIQGINVVYVMIAQLDDDIDSDKVSLPVAYSVKSLYWQCQVQTQQGNFFLCQHPTDSGTIQSHHKN